MMKTTGYHELLENGELDKRVSAAKKHLAECDVCPWVCGVNRLEGELGVCRTGRNAQISSYFPHFGEEKPISGQKGSGTIFFAQCNLSCVFCQNMDISQMGVGQPVDEQNLAEMMLELQKMGCHNINLVSPSHVIPQILSAVHIAALNGLHLPLVYNTGGYDSLEMLKLLNGVVDIYMPDMKYGDEKTARKYSLVRDYPKINQLAVLEMQRQVGDLKIGENGIAIRGEVILHFLADKVSNNVYLNIMPQYHPAFKSKEFPELDRRIRPEEYQRVVEKAQSLGLNRLDV